MPSGINVAYYACFASIGQGLALLCMFDISASVQLSITAARQEDAVCVVCRSGQACRVSLLAGQLPATHAPTALTAVDSTLCTGRVCTKSRLEPCWRWLVGLFLNRL